MRLLLALLATVFVSMTVCNVQAAPEDDRLRLLKIYKENFPGVPSDQYIYGAMIASPDAKAQYDSIMEFPPFQDQLEKGKKLWETPFKNGKTFANCFPNGGRNIAGNYPYYDEKLDKVVTFEMAINRCLKQNGEAEYKYGEGTMGLVTAYARTLSDGMKMSIKVDSPGALRKYEAGKKYYFSRTGQLNFACASCHTHNAGKVLRTEILSPTIGQATHWPVFRGGDRLTTLHARYKRCLEQVRTVPFEMGSEEFNNLEYFHSYLSNGLPMYSSVYRK